MAHTPSFVLDPSFFECFAAFEQCWIQKRLYDCVVPPAFLLSWHAYPSWLPWHHDQPFWACGHDEAALRRPPWWRRFFALLLHERKCCRDFLMALASCGAKTSKRLRARPWVVGRARGDSRQHHQTRFARVPDILEFCIQQALLALLLRRRSRTWQCDTEVP